MKKLRSAIIIIVILVIIFGIYLYKLGDEVEETTNSVATENVVNDEKDNKVSNNSVANNTNTTTNNEVNPNENAVKEETSKTENKLDPNSKIFDLVADGSFDIDEAKKLGVPVIVEFGASYCPPCRQMEPILKKLNEEYKGKVIIKTVDLEEYPELSFGYDTSLIPTQIFITKEGNPYYPKDNPYRLQFAKLKQTGELIYTCHTGFMPEKDLRKIIEDMVK